MKVEDLNWLLENDKEIPGLTEISEFNDQVVVNCQIALTLHSVSSIYIGESEIEVKDKFGNLVGILCLCKGANIDLSKMTDVQMVCYLTEIERDHYELPYQFQNNYLVLEVDNFEDYNRKYLDTSFVWGGFVHALQGVRKPRVQAVTSITAIPDMKLPTRYHTETGVRGIGQPFAFERFLKSYHLLELLFDYDFVHGIKGLPDDLKGVGPLLAKYDRDETERLKSIIETRCRDYDAIAQKLNSAFSSPESKSKVETIFFDFGKSHNPINDDRRPRYDQLVLLGGFTEPNATASRLATTRTLYEKLVLDIAVYWIYRIRCSIAHNRIGEYVMTMDDEEFVVEFAEPLIKEILIQAFSV